MKIEIILLGCPVYNIKDVAKKVSENINLKLMEMSNEKYGDEYYSSTLLKITNRFGLFVDGEGVQYRPKVSVFPRINTRYGYINDDDLGDYPVGISLVWINEIETLLPKLLADPELKLELLKTWPSE
jgi:hypothetical protein